MVAGGGEPAAPGLLFDTSVVIAAFGDEGAVTARLRRFPADRIFVPVIVVGELAFGALTSSRVSENLGRIAEFADVANIVPCDADTARLYGEVKAQLKRIGRPIPENDVWIAAIARQHRLTLVTRDAHFAHVDGLHLERW